MYQTVIEKTRGLAFRTQAIGVALERTNAAAPAGALGGSAGAGAGAAGAGAAAAAEQVPLVEAH